MGAEGGGATMHKKFRKKAGMIGAESLNKKRKDSTKKRETHGAAT